MKILSIGNSFSQDATRYLHQIADADGVSLDVVNLFIGGCSLKSHFINARDDNQAYSLELNGNETSKFVSIKEALQSEPWDVVTLQQVSHESNNYQTYQPYLGDLVAYVRKYSPNSKLYIHQTWAYENGSERLCHELQYADYHDMLCDIVSAYDKASQDIRAHGIIPSGQLFSALLDNGIAKVHRDTFHASLGLGRYALGLLWYAVLCGHDVMHNTFDEFDEPIAEADIGRIKDAVTRLAQEFCNTSSSRSR